MERKQKTNYKMNKIIIGVLRKLGVKFVFISLIAFTGCSESVENVAIQESNINAETEIDITKLIGTFSNHYESTETMISAFEEVNETQTLKSGEDNDSDVLTIHVSTEDVVRYTESDLAEIYSKEQKEFLLGYFNVIANTDDSELLPMIAYYKQELDKSDLTGEEYNQIYSILDIAEQTVVSLNDMLPNDAFNNKAKQSNLYSRDPNWDAFVDCMASKGKYIARGLAAGAIAGAGWGAWVGATGGTVALPGIGTAAGAVGGAVFGAAKGAVTGAATATLWAAADCAHHLGSNSNGSGGSYGLEAAGCDRVTVQTGNHGMVFKVCN